MTILEKLERHSNKHYDSLGLGKNQYSSFVDSNFEWACDNCLENKKAILAIPGLQGTPWTPHLAYFNTQLKCYTCQKEFLFKKEEKKAWFESYKLPINARPDNCLACRRANKKLNNENKALSEIIRKSEPKMSESELEKVIEIYSSWNKMDKVKYFQSVLSKRQKK